MPAIRSHHWPSSLSCSPPERPTERLALSRLLSKFATQPLRELEQENAGLKKIVADLTLDKEMLQDVIKRKL